MDIFQGLSAQQVGIIRHTRTFMSFYPGEVIFAEGEYAHCMYLIMSGLVEIYRNGPQGPVAIARLGRGETFGEMGILISCGRTASARALEQTSLLEIPKDVVQALLKSMPPGSGVIFMQNLFCLLAERLKVYNAKGHGIPKSTVLQFSDLVQQDMDEAMAVLERNLPKGIGGLFSGKRKLAKGEILCKEGAPPDGFYYLNEGSLDVIKGMGTNQGKWLARIIAPAVTGEIGFFTKTPRNATLVATEDCLYTHFPGDRFNKLAKSDPEEAMKVLMAAAQVIVYMMLK